MCGPPTIFWTPDLRKALERNALNRLAAAKELGIHKSTLFRKIKRLAIPAFSTDRRRNDRRS